MNGIAKPAYRAFEMLNTAGDQRLPVVLTGQEWSPTPDATYVALCLCARLCISVAVAVFYVCDVHIRVLCVGHVYHCVCMSTFLQGYKYSVASPKN